MNPRGWNQRYHSWTSPGYPLIFNVDCVTSERDQDTLGYPGKGFQRERYGVWSLHMPLPMVASRGPNSKLLNSQEKRTVEDADNYGRRYRGYLLEIRAVWSAGRSHGICAGIEVLVCVMHEPVPLLTHSLQHRTLSRIRSALEGQRQL